MSFHRRFLLLLPLLSATSPVPTDGAEQRVDEVLERAHDTHLETLLGLARGRVQAVGIVFRHGAEQRNRRVCRRMILRRIMKKEASKACS
ncbi:hypothetical protein PF005_g12069 [Phytophthora fragariae]|uniref:RxLR effector protein n=1 Tax=Phytophthora fragariae TaxID=53985 RepID=A0A6A3XWZ6_9STRA|nr:hypothetical protein PF011_g11151 [Phytophthora fragariae]KAE9109138.1 hypothetical protein PF010_g11651 [Phytophthora fragariae]KAE9208793.1 hypothetical protein PF005_g12069 [Phytophthora fragariae]KAE9227615.1 hypothetical protein PF004_g11308 [Phytophthora fragariae]KAE9232372.1 hypothetical protein PF002_g12395 [Phytophthora fragariae]